MENQTHIRCYNCGKDLNDILNDKQLSDAHKDLPVLFDYHKTEGKHFSFIHDPTVGSYIEKNINASFDKRIVSDNKVVELLDSTVIDFFDILNPNKYKNRHQMFDIEKETPPSGSTILVLYINYFIRAEYWEDANCKDMYKIKEKDTNIPLTAGVRYWMYEPILPSESE